MKTYPNLEKARARAATMKRSETAERRRTLKDICAYAKQEIENIEVAKIALAMLYLGEGSKSRKKSIVTFANSDPKVIALFLRLLRASFRLDERKFRCTVQCRADQDSDDLRSYWMTITEVPIELFYKTQVDPRTVGKPTLKPDYKGVLRIDYLSSMLFNELLLIAETLCEGR